MTETLGAVHGRLHDLGYAVTSARNPERLSNGYARASFIALRDDPAAVMTYPRAANGAAVEDGAEREILSLVLTAYLLSNQKEAKAVQSVLSERGLLAGPCRTDGFGNRLYPLKWSGPPIFDGEYTARLTHDDDDATVFFEHAIAPNRFVQRTDGFSRVQSVAAEPVGSHIIPLDGDWKGGSLLDTPRERLPEITASEGFAGLVSDMERARWGARPAAA